MFRNLVGLSLAAGLLTACVATPENTFVGTKNGENYYAYYVNGASKKAYDMQLNHYGNQICPQGFRVADSKLEAQRMTSYSMDRFFKITIACPAR